MQLNEMFRIWDRFETSNVSEFVYESKTEKIVLKKGADFSAPIVSRGSFENHPADHKEDAADSHGRDDSLGTLVKAPFVGTFYSASSPGEEPFVKLGQKVKKGDVVGIIEAMKLMNEIISPCDGLVKEIYIEDETMVEYDQPLILLESVTNV